MTNQPPLLEMRGITKRFGRVTANDGIDLTLAAGEIVGLLGENGAGKTTLMNILFGGYDADAGTIRIDGKPAAIRSSADALALGVGMVHQHYHLVPVAHRTGEPHGGPARQAGTPRPQPDPRRAWKRFVPCMG